MTRSFPVQSSILDAAALAARVLPLYELPQPLSCRLLQAGDNDTYLVQAGSPTSRQRRRYALRVYRHAKHSAREIQGEIDVLALMARSSIAVAPAIARRDGACISQLNAPAILDWDGTGYGWRAYDLAVLLWSTALQGLGTALWDAYIAGYQEPQEPYGYPEGRPLTEAELAAVPHFVAARHIWVMGVEMGHVLDGTWGVGRIDDRWLDCHLSTLSRWARERCGFPLDLRP